MFLNGKDPSVDYTKIDQNQDLDDGWMEDQDAEDKYFDEIEDESGGQDPENNTGIQDF